MYIHTIIKHKFRKKVTKYTNAVSILHTISSIIFSLFQIFIFFYYSVCM